MLRDINKLFEGFQDIVKKSKKQCGEKLEEMQQLTLVTNV